MGLGVLGLDELQRRVYQELVHVGSAALDELATRCDVARGQVGGVLAGLERLGLVARDGAASDMFVAAPPDVALGAMILEHEERLRQAESEVLLLGQQYRAALSGQADAVDVVRGADAVRQRFNQLQRGANEEVLLFVKGEVVAVSREDNTEEEVAHQRGVTYRYVMERSRLEQSGMLEVVQDAVREGMQVRVAEELPIRLIVVDREIAMIPLASTGQDQSGGALLLHAGGLLDMAVSLFDRTWRSAADLVLDADNMVAEQELDDVERQVLALLHAGFTDRTIASRLDVSVRTVQRRVRDLMDRAEVNTRLQLGVVAVTRGWLDAAAPRLG